MRYRSLGWIMMGAWLGAWPLAARADYLSDARAALTKGDLRTAQIDLRNAVRNDPQNADAHYWLGRVTLELGDPVAAEREARAARERGYDPRQAIGLESQAMLAQGRFNDLLNTLKPDGKDPLLDASILVARGYAQTALNRPDEAQKSFAEAERLAPDAVEPLLADARLSVARADLADAQAKIDRVLSAQPKSAEARLAKAQLLRLKDDTQGAMTVLDALVTDQPGLIQARLERAGLEIAAGKKDAAQADISLVLKAMPGNVQAIYLTAVMQEQAHDYKAADTSLEHIAAYIGRIQRGYYLQAVVKQQLGQYEQAEDAARKFLAHAPGSPAAYKLLARIEFARQRPDQAIDTLTKLVGSGQGGGQPDAETYDLLGRAYAATGQSQEALNAFQKAEALAPNDVGVQARLASVRMGMGDVDSAMGDLEHTLALAPKQPAVSEELFFAALATGDVKKAADALEKIQAAQGDTPVVANLQGLFKLSQVDFPGARATFEALAAQHPDFIPGRINLARLDFMLGNNADAEKQLTDILARQPTNSPALNMLASAYARNNRLPDAIALLERAHQAEPATTRITLNLGELYIRGGTPRKALDLALAEKGEAAAANEILGLRAAANLALGQKDAAREVYEQILRQAPSQAGVRRQLVALLVDAKEFESARNVLKAGIANNPRDYRFYLDNVEVDLKSSGLDAALASADRLQAEARDVPAIHALKGDLYLTANQPAQAVTAFRAAFQDTPSTLLATRLAGALVRSGQSDQGRQVLLDWLSQHPDDLTVIEQVSEIEIALGNYDGAAAHLKAVLAQKPHNVVALNNLAWVYQTQGRAQDARDLARQAYVLSPGPQTADTLGWILTSLGEARTGIPLLRQASVEAASDPRILYHYAVALNDTGDKVAAKKQLQAAVAFKADFKEKQDAQKLLDHLAKGS